ncbi:hypothetical protein [Athalassotoga sp.]|uniref:Uncharacterized protein n=1 Tax=Caldisericum exile TaxID=693075 RepID=A0A2J6X6R6_9BACT|nr:MAG: hypothetical protein C0175_03320 [Caldisericum exile]HEM55478.1 hypothetical protein [Thermodesulfobium narugense]
MTKKITLFLLILVSVISLLGFSNELLESITYPYYLPTWQNGEFWQYSISTVASKEWYVIYHSWISIPATEITSIKYVVLQMRHFDDVPSYEYVILKEVHTNQGTILDINYAPVCNLQISSLKEDLSYYFDFPLYVGKKWQVFIPTIKSQIPIPQNPEMNKYYPLKAEVTSTQTIATSAGEFETIIVENKYKNGQTYEVWYSPTVKNYVKFVVTNNYSYLLTQYGKIESLKSYVIEMIKSMPSEYFIQRYFIVNTLYQYGFFTLKESLELQ